MKKRFQKGESKWPKALREEVVAYYEEHGRAKTEEAFPGVKVRSIVEGTPRKLRWSRWTKEQLIELPKMVGLISYKKQAQFFNRPKAGPGSITSAWNKRFGMRSVYINGLPFAVVKYFVTRDCPMLRTEGTKVYRSYAGEKKRPAICLWVDVEKHLRPGTPQFVVEAIQSLSEFQRWLHGKDAKKNIIEMVNARGGDVIETTIRDYNDKWRIENPDKRRSQAGYYRNTPERKAYQRAWKAKRKEMLRMKRHAEGRCE